jgi:dihydropyrimidinase
VVWDPAATKTISAKRQVSRIEYNVFEGFALTGLPAKVFLRGKLAAENGEVRAERGQGRFVPRRPLPPYAEALRRWKERTAPRAVAR